MGGHFLCAAAGVTVLASGCLLAAHGLSPSAGSHAQKRVLVLHLAQPDSKLSRSADDTYRRSLGRALGDRLDYYSEYIDISRFGEVDWRRSFREFLRSRYEPLGLDLVIAPNTAQLRMLRDDDGGLFNDVPIVFHAGVGVRGDARSTGIVTRVDLASGVRVALELHPRTRRILVIVGAGAFDADYERLARAQLEPLASRVSLEYVVGRPVGEMEQMLSRLPADTLVYFLVYSRDTAGTRWLPFEVASRLSRAASVPIYGPHEGYVGSGVVGGAVFSTEVTVEATAAIALRILAGEAPAQIPLREIDPYIVLFDWRALSRWHIPEGRLPPGSRVMFRPPSAWTRYRVVGVTVVVMAAIVGTWWFEHRRRRRAEEQSSVYLDAVADLERRATLDHFSASLAHELKQPLTAIEVNVAAAQRYLERGGLEHPQVREILGDVASNSRRAVEIIDHVRSLARHHAQETQAIDINALIRETIGIVASAAERLSARVEIDLPDPAPTVSGDRVHLQQALLNLLRNGLEAVQERDPSERLVLVRARLVRSQVEIEVQDRGAGIPERVAKQLFQPFVTSKPEGLGMGLFIVRSIVEAHGGNVDAVNHPNGGAAVRLLLPVNRAA